MPSCVSSVVDFYSGDGGNQGVEDCVIMNGDHSYEWVDVSCETKTFPVICETK